MRPRSRTRLSLERLEDRIAPAMLNFLGVSANWNDPANWIGGALPTPADDVILGSAGPINLVNVNDTSVQVHGIVLNAGFTLSIAGDLKVDIFQFNGGTINGPGALYVSQTLNWSGGVMGGTGVTNILASASANVQLTATTGSGGLPGFPPSGGASTALANSRTFLNLGATTWNGPFAVASTALFSNQGTTTFVGTDFTWDATSRLQNTGTVAFNHANVHFHGPLTLNSTINFLNGQQDKMVVINGNVTIQNVTLQEDLHGTGTLTVPGTFAWDSGRLVGTGSVVVPAGGTFDMPTIGGFRKLDGRTLTVQGQRTWVVEGVTGTLPPRARLSSATGNPLLPAYAKIYAWSDALWQTPDLPFDNKQARPQTNSAGMSSPITMQQADLLAGQIYDAMYGGVFGAGVDKDAVFRALEGRTVADVNLVKSMYSARYRHSNGDPRDMQADLFSQWQFSTSSESRSRLEALLAGNLAGALAETFRQLLNPSENLAGWASTSSILPLREFLYRADIGALSTEYASRFPVENKLFLSPNAPQVDENLPRLQYDTLVILSRSEQSRVDNMLGQASLDEIHDLRLSFELLFQGNRPASDAVAIHGLIAGNGTAALAEPIIGLVEARSKTERDALAAEYLNRYSQTLPASLGNWNPSQQSALGLLLSGGAIQTAVLRLRRAFDQNNNGSTDDWDGTDENAVWNTLDGLYADERAMVAQVYRNTYNKTLLREIDDEFSDNIFDGPERTKTFRLYTHGGLSVAERVYFATEGLGTDEDAIRRAMGELRQMTAAEIEGVNGEYGQMVPQVTEPNSINMRSATLADAFRGDLSGGLLNDAILSLEGRLTTVEQFYQLARRRHGYERAGDANWIGNFVSGINTQGQNLDATWQAIQTEYANIANKNDPIDNHATFRQLIQRIDQDVESYRGFRSAAAELAANGLSTVAGIAAFALTGGAIAPMIVALAAGSTTQALTRMGIEGYFTWEQLPADLLVGGANALLAGLSLPQAAGAGVRFGVLRAVASNPFANGAAMTGISVAVREDTWSQGFGVGFATIAQTSLLGGLGATALARVPGAVVSFARTSGLTNLRRTVLIPTGQTLYNVFDRTFVGAVRLANVGGQLVRDAIESTLTPARITSITNFLFNQSEQQTLTAIRDGLRNLLSDLPPLRLNFAAEAAMSVVESSRSEFATLGTQGIRERLLNSMQAMYNRFTEAVDSVFSRMTGASVSNATRELAENLAERLATITEEITDDAVIRARITEAIQAVAPAEVANQQLITAIRNLLVVRSLPGANSALRTLGEQFTNRARQLYAMLNGVEMRSTTIDDRGLTHSRERPVG